MRNGASKAGIAQAIKGDRQRASRDQSGTQGRYANVQTARQNIRDALTGEVAGGEIQGRRVLEPDPGDPGHAAQRHVGEDAQGQQRNQRAHITAREADQATSATATRHDRAIPED